MKTGTMYIVDGKFTDQYALGKIDSTHVFLKRYKGERPSENDISNGHVFHIAQLKGMADGLYEIVTEWLSGDRQMINIGFEA